VEERRRPVLDRQVHRHDAVAEGQQLGREALPAPSPVPRPVHQHERAHDLTVGPGGGYFEGLGTFTLQSTLGLPRRQFNGPATMVTAVSPTVRQWTSFLSVR